MAESSEGEDDLPLTSLSAKNRRFAKRSHISSDSDEEKRNARSSGKQVNSSTRKTSEHSARGSEINKTPCISQTPRTSERLRKKGSRSFSLPSREKLLDAISPGTKLKSQRKVKALKPRRLVNNFLRERSSYVSRGEGHVDSDDSGMSDFINDDDDEDEDEDESAESNDESDRSSESNKKDSGICSAGGKKKALNKKRVMSSSEEHGESNNDDDDDIPLSNLRKKETSQEKRTANIGTANSSDSEESFTARNKTCNKRRKVIQCSDSDEDMEQSIKQEKTLPSRKKDISNESEDSDRVDSLHKTKNTKFDKVSVPLRPRSRRVQNLTQQHEDKNRKMFGALLDKRQTAKLDCKERLERKQLPGNDLYDSSTSDSSSSEVKRDPFQEAEEIFMQHSSELEEDDDDRDFIVDDEQSSDEGLNSDGASQFLRLLDTFTGKQKDEEEVNGLETGSRGSESRSFKSLRKRRRKKRERRVSKWRRIKMADDSEGSDHKDDTMSDMTHRHPPLHGAILENDVDLVKKQLSEDSDCVYELGYRKRTALHIAALEDRVELVKLLLDHGADRTAVDCYHLPAIAYAADGHPDCLRLLLDHANIKNVSKSMRKNLQEMNLLHFAVGEKRDGLECDNRARCLELLFSQDKKVCSKLLEERDARMFSPVVAAVYAGQHKCIQVLLKMGANVLAFKTDDGGNILHFAVECASHFKGAWETGRETSLCLKELLKSTKLLVNDADDHGFTPLMYACESGNDECVKVLLENGASMKCSDSHGTSSLHLAAMSGDTQCVQLLLDFGHQVDCVDRYGWPPLLYANFKAHESCVLALMKPKPEQVFVLGELLRRARNELEKKRTVKVVKNVLVSLANHDAYYTVFNDFIRQNPEMLDENNYGLLQHTWRAILDFDNKRRWFLRKLSQIRGSSYSWSCETVYLDIDRENVLGSAMNQMGKILGHALRNRSLYVTFKNEPGTCTGPKREFFACFCRDVINLKRGLFLSGDDSQYSPVPNAYFAKHVSKEMQPDSSQNPVHETGVTRVKQELPSNELTDEELISAITQEDQSTANEFSRTQEDHSSGHVVRELMSSEMQESVTNDLTDEELTSSLMQTEEPSMAVINESQRVPVGGTDSQTVNSDLCNTQLAAEDSATGQAALEQDDLNRDTSGEENLAVDEAAKQEHDANTSNNAHDENISQAPQQSRWISCMESNSGDKSIINLSLRSKLKQLRFIGRMIGFAVCQDLLLNLHLSKPFVKQILGIPLSHPDDLSSFDYELHRNAVVWVRENSVNELDLPFSVDALDPWNSKPVTIELSDDTEKKLTDDNKEEYIKLVSQLKLETTIKDEVAEFAGGLNEVIPREFLSLFTADEFSLLIGGVTKIDVGDWKKNTKYQGCSSEDVEITWFWNVVWQLKEEEKALLMKFSTGSPCVPIGGFAALTGLSGATKFTILKIGGLNKIPMASTCFNMLKLTSYSSEKHLKDKLLIAIRHGAEGFSFG